MSEENKRDRLEFEGEVINSCRGIFQVKLDNGQVVQATLSGKIRKNAVKILLSDRVLVELSEMDTSRARIVYRLKE